MKSLKSVCTVLMLLASLGICAQKPIVVYLWPNGAPNDNGQVGEEIVTNSIVKNITKPNITIFPSSKPNSKAIIVCPGGGYAQESLGWDKMAPWMNSMNITEVILKYRLPNGHPDALLSDVQEAIKLVREHAKEWNINPNQVGIMGSSAGGHLAAFASNYYTKESRPDFQVLLYPVITMDKKETHMGTREGLIGKNGSNKKAEKYSMELQVTENTPRAFIVLCSDDNVVPPVNSVKYYMALINHKVSATMHIYPIGGHGFGYSDKMFYKYQWTGELEKWLSTF